MYKNLIKKNVLVPCMSILLSATFVSSIFASEFTTNNKEEDSIYIDEIYITDENRDSLRLAEGILYIDEIYITDENRDSLRLAEGVLDNEDVMARVTITSRVDASRPLVGGVMTATATTSSTHIIHTIRVRARVNNSGTSMSTGTWTTLNNTYFASATQDGTGRSGIAHGDHEYKLFASDPIISRTTTDNRFQ